MVGTRPRSSSLGSVLRASGRRWILIGLASIGFGYACWLLLSSGGLPVVPPAEVIWRLELTAVFAYSGLWLLTLFFKAFRLRFQLLPLGSFPLHRVFSASVVGYAGQLLLPFKTGELARPALVSRGSDIPFLAAVSTSATERIVDAIFGSVLLLLCLPNADLLQPLPDRIGDLPVPVQLVPVLGYAFAAVALVSSVVVGVFYARRKECAGWLNQSLGPRWPNTAKLLRLKLEELADGFALLTDRKQALRYVLVTALYWISYTLGLWYVVAASGFNELSLSQAGVIAGTLAFSFAIPNAPGYFGVFQVAIYAALAAFFAPAAVQDQGATAVFWIYVLQLGWLLALTPVGVLVEWWSIRRARALTRVAEVGLRL